MTASATFNFSGKKRINWPLEHLELEGPVRVKSQRLPCRSQDSKPTPVLIPLASSFTRCDVCDEIIKYSCTQCTSVPNTFCRSPSLERTKPAVRSGSGETEPGYLVEIKTGAFTGPPGTGGVPHWGRRCTLPSNV